MSEQFSRRVDVRIIKDEPMTRDQHLFSLRMVLSTRDDALEELDALYAEYLERFQAYRFRAKAANFEIISHGENYLHEVDCINAVELLFGDDTTCYWARKYGEDRGDNWLRYGVTDRRQQAAATITGLLPSPKAYESMISGPSLAQRMLAAAQTLEDYAAEEGLELPDRTPYSAWELRRTVQCWRDA